MRNLIAAVIFIAIISTVNSISSAANIIPENNASQSSSTEHKSSNNNQKQESTAPTTIENKESTLNYLTAALVFVGILQLAAFLLQAYRLRQTIDVMHDTAERQLRAYVCISGSTIKFDRKDTPVAHVEYENSGQTPAYDVRIWLHMWISEYPLTEELPEPPPTFITSSAILPPGGKGFMIIPKVPPVCPCAVGLLGTPKGTIYIYGKISYRDAFNVERFTKYRLMYGGSEAVHAGRLSPHTEGNEAN